MSSGPDEGVICERSYFMLGNWLREPSRISVDLLGPSLFKGRVEKEALSAEIILTI